jgi:phosphoribosylaminoimidazolecarboxamide formyltransferase/IMP cyclohydrolase
MKLRYGMNPHQAAEVTSDPPFRVLTGEPSLINVLDAMNAWALVQELNASTGEVAATSFKHVSPAGSALAGPLDEVQRLTWAIHGSDAVTAAYVRARDADPRSSFGDFVAISHPVTRELAGFLATVVSDGIIAPAYEEGCLAVLAAKKRGTFLVLEADPAYRPLEDRRTGFGVGLLQTVDTRPVDPSAWDLVCGTPPTLRDAVLGQVTLKHTQSNSVLMARDGMCLGIAAGQQSRIDCTRLAGAKTAAWWLRRHPALVAGDSPRHDKVALAARLDQVQGLLAPAWMDEPGPLTSHEVRSWLAGLHDVTAGSDGYLPFADNIEELARYGVSCVVEPGGSMRSPDVVDACERLGISLIHTRHRLFHH